MSSQFLSSFYERLCSRISLSTPGQIFVLISFLWLIRELRLELREYKIGRRARACNARLAPKAYSPLPFGISYVLDRTNLIATGTISDLRHPFSRARGISPGTQVIRTHYLGIEMIHTLSHLDAKHVLTTGFQKWGKSPDAVEGFQPLLGDGVFSSDQRGLWSWHRSLIRPHFTRKRVSDLDASEEHIHRVVKWLKNKTEVDEGADIQDGKSFISNFYTFFSRFTLTSSSQHLFGKCLDMLNDLTADRPAEDDLIDAARFSQALQDATMDAMKSSLLPSLLRRAIHAVTMPNKSIKIVTEMVDKLLSCDQGNTDGGEGQEINLVESLRQSGCSPEMLRFELLNVLIAARDTTASLLTSCIYELAGRDELWKRLQMEAAEISTAAGVSLEDLSKLKLLRAVLNETLRLHPPLWTSTRHAYEDDVLPSGIFVPAGTDIQYYMHAFHRDRKLWGENADDFVPGRWLEGSQTEKSRDPSAFQPFSAGPRICIGQQSGAELVGPSACKDSIQEAPTLVLSYRGGLWAKFHKLKEG
ncbi:cytochrome P450 monooxygenase [Melampsora larici-populina 98AG31]|uniref:Cytochrome P450 monooxygenase n=1 Tax=Melampsora larici-populina (strain 98AG31 / pathotype 3-4-7) TaxID=747676 RepID=F4RX79_MELLP|nr:cytochrome P450 monooxygenase [Melampsora larici-populina 98AG31]EGG02922.1 cytochrome P450 monooxygenase [Melampsora larici-populina 98AG31]